MKHEVTPLIEGTAYRGRGVAGPNNSDTAVERMVVGGISAIAMRNVSLVGAGYILDNETGRYIYDVAGIPLFPPWVEEYTGKGLSYVVGRQEDTKSLLARAMDLEPVRVGPCYTFAHYNFVYGHFLIEMLPKLFLIRERYRQGHVYPIALPRAIRSWVMPHVLSVFPEAVLISFDDSKHRIAPEILIGIGGEYVQHPWFISKCRELGSGAPAKRKIFVTRPSNHFSTRVFANNSEIEEIAVNRGFEVVEPSGLSLPDQAKLFSEASMVAGEFTSAFHNTLFSPPGTVTVAINRVAAIQWRIANACGHYLDYVTPDEGNVEWGPKPIEFHVSPENFNRALDAAFDYAASA